MHLCTKQYEKIESLPSLFCISTFYTARPGGKKMVIIDKLQDDVEVHVHRYHNDIKE